MILRYDIFIFSVSARKTSEASFLFRKSMGDVCIFISRPVLILFLENAKSKLENKKEEEPQNKSLCCPATKTCAANPRSAFCGEALFKN